MIESAHPSLNKFYLSVFGGVMSGSLPCNFLSFGETHSTPKNLKAPPLLRVVYTELIVTMIVSATTGFESLNVFMSLVFGKSKYFSEKSVFVLKVNLIYLLN